MPTLYPGKELAKKFNVSESTLARWRSTGDGPTYTKCGRRVLYDSNDVNQWLNANRHSSTSSQQIAGGN